MEHNKDEEACDHMSHMDNEELDSMAKSICQSGKVMTQMVHGTPADWAAILALAALAARHSAQLQENKTPAEVLAFIDGHVERSRPAIELALTAMLMERDTKQTLSPGSTEKN
jgi:hypothetical protein